MNIHPYYFSSQKRQFDFWLALVMLIFFSPFIFMIGAAVFVTAGRPVIFRQKRTGQRGQIFTILKFRTMQKNAAMIQHRYQHLNEAPSPMFKIHDDPRYIGVGRWLARTGIDELPQLWNILKGEMSFVGPRPLPVKEARNLPAVWREWREKVRPGVFSRWALSAEKHTTLDKWEQLEKMTVQSGSVRDDLQLLLTTVFALLFK